MYGCLHNRETGNVNSVYPSGYGFLMQPPVNSGFRTIMASVLLKIYTMPLFLYAIDTEQQN
jgi:hypothetical protein